jgi:hypothetical protein
VSVHAISQALKIRGVSPSEKLVLLVLANYADEHQRSFPSHKRLADETGLSERTILTAMKALEARGLLSRQERRRADGSRSTDLITLQWGGETIAPRGENPAPPTATVAPRGEVVAPLTTFEPSPNLEGSNDPSSKTRASKRCPADWMPRRETIQTLADEGYQAGQLERALTMLRDHQFPVGKTDWDATFRNWVRNDRSIRPAGRSNVQYQPDQRQAAREDNLARAIAGAEAASRFRAVGG